jgi:hypothetical protein
MSSRTVFRFESGEISFELSGSEQFVRKNLPAFMPFVGRVAGIAPADGAKPQAAEGGAAASGPGPLPLKAWYDKHVPLGTRVSMQDAILVFALWMRGFKKYIFTSEDIRRAFEEMGQPEPKSLLQILGTLKRDHNLILGTERRGEYMLNTTGIERAKRLLGMPVGAPRPDESSGGEAAAHEGEASGVAAARVLADI